MGGARGQRGPSQQGGPQPWPGHRHTCLSQPLSTPRERAEEGGGPWGAAGTPARVTRLSSGNPTHNVRGTSAAPGRRTCFSGTGGRNQRLELHFLAGGCPTLRSEGSVFWTSLRFQIVVHVTPQRPLSIGEISRLEAMGRQAGTALISRAGAHALRAGTAGCLGLFGTQIPGPGCRRFARRSQKRSRQIKAWGRTPAWPPAVECFPRAPL